MIICIWGDTAQEVQIQINTWVQVAQKYGLIFSEEKSEILILSRENDTNRNNIEMHGKQLKTTGKFK